MCVCVCVFINRTDLTELCSLFVSFCVQETTMVSKTNCLHMNLFLAALLKKKKIDEIFFFLFSGVAHVAGEGFYKWLEGKFILFLSLSSHRLLLSLKGTFSDI